jgi:alkanesulfonate monooxygenase SsuD/methylene tetrahydromethanopterin reductase-like flavin-dependent oxidoreductase (luciferase family)
VIRAARYGLPLMLAIIGGDPARFAPHVDLYKRTLQEHGRPPQPIGMHSLGFVAETDAEAIDIQWPHWNKLLGAASLERGWAPPTLSRFQDEIINGSLYVGSPQTVATKLASAIQVLGLSRFDLAYAVGEIPHEQRMETIELYGREVVPRVRELLAEQSIQARVA